MPGPGPDPGADTGAYLNRRHRRRSLEKRRVGMRAARRSAALFGIGVFWFAFGFIQPARGRCAWPQALHTGGAAGRFRTIPRTQPEAGMQQEALAYTFDWRRDEHAEVSTLLLREQFGRGPLRVLKWVAVAIVVFSALLTLALVALGGIAEVTLLAPLTALVALLLIFFYPLTGRLRAWQLRRTDPNVAHPITHTLDASGFHATTHTANSDLRWAGLHKVRETPGYFLFHYNRRIAYFLPKRALGSDAEIDRVRAFIETHLPPEVPFERDDGDE